MEPASNNGKPLAPPEVRWGEFLQSFPPGTKALIADFVPQSLRYSASIYKGAASNPDLRLHCDNEACDGERTFQCTTPLGTVQLDQANYLLSYQCRNCSSVVKHYAVRMLAWETNKVVLAVKMGEYPSFGPPTPRKLLALLGADSGTFLKGRQAENQGLGVGAFAYYRRVVENQKSRLINEIIKVARREQYPSEMIDELTAASQERQFTKAVGTIKAGIPKSLLIKDHNPLTLLHDALSEGLHAESDDVCLRMAGAIRVILVQLADRLSELLRDDAQVSDAVTMLLKKGKQP